MIKPKEQQINAGLLSLRDKLTDGITAKGGTPDPSTLNTLVDSIETIPQGGGGIPVVDPPQGAFYAAIAYFTAENGDFDNVAYAFANNSAEFSAQFCHSTTFANFTLHGTAGGSDSVVIPNSKICGFFFGSQFNLTALPNYFLAYCFSFNAPLTLPEGLTSIGSYFLAYCYTFNSPLSLPESLTTINEYFLYYCYTFNQPLILPIGIYYIRDNFLRNCFTFNSPLTLPQYLSSIGTYFLGSCYAFNQSLTLPQYLSSIGAYFIQNCQTFNRLIANCSISPTDNSSLSTTIADAFMYVNGITVSGAYAQTWITKLPNITSSPYRKLILAQ